MHQLPFHSWFLAGFLFLFAMGIYIPGQAQPPKGRKTPTLSNKAILAKISANLGKQLNSKQKQQITEALESLKTGVTNAQAAYLKHLTDVTGLPGAALQELLPGTGEENSLYFQRLMVPRMETKLGRPLSSNEREAVERAEANKKEIVGPLHTRFAEKVGEITNLPIPEILGMLPKAGF